MIQRSRVHFLILAGAGLFNTYLAALNSIYPRPPATATLGERLYIDNCNACHLVAGNGAPRVFPRLDGASVVNAENAAALIEVMLAGAETPSTARAPSVLPMPGFAYRLSDSEAAELATFVRQAWSNKAGAVSEKEVREVRARLNQEHGEALSTSEPSKAHH